jgi:hypothetical protein
LATRLTWAGLPLEQAVAQLFANIGTVLVATATTLVTLYVREGLTRNREKLTVEEQKTALARRISIEIAALNSHNSANIRVIQKLKAVSTFGQSVDIQKMRFGEKGLLNIDLNKVADLPKYLALDVMRLYLFLRNNDMEILAAETLIFTDGIFTRDDKDALMSKLEQRFAGTRETLEKIERKLEEYAGSPSRYVDKSVTWPDDQKAFAGYIDEEGRLDPPDSNG